LSLNLLILVVDDEPDVEVLFRQQFRRDLRAGSPPFVLHDDGEHSFQVAINCIARAIFLKINPRIGHFLKLSPKSAF
jgi:hypothetical protein